MKYLTYVGCSTDDAHPQGLHLLESDNETGDFRKISSLELTNPIYMALNRSCTRLYTVLERPHFGPKGRNGGIAAFAVNGDKLDFLNEIATGWTVPCYVALDPSEQTLVYAEYSCGTAGYAELQADGSIDPRYAGTADAINPLCQVRHFGEGPNQPRQDKAHAHCAIVTPDGKYQLVVDLTLDQVKAYDFLKRAQGLKEVPAATINTLPPGAGPRHIVFHPNGKLAFVLFELTSRISSYRYNGENFELVDSQSLIPEGFGDFSKAAAIKISEDGTQVFCSNRGHDSIAVFNLDTSTGKLEHLNTARLDGQFPRDFEFMPGGKFMMVGLKESWRVASYAYDRNQGKFEIVAKQEGIYRPLFFKFKTI